MNNIKVPDIRIDARKFGVSAADPSQAAAWRAPTQVEALRFALTDSPHEESDQSQAQKAQMLGNVYFDLLERAQRDVDPGMDDQSAREEACYFSAAMTGIEDAYGTMWRKGGFKTGKEYLAYMRDFFKKAPDQNLTQRYRDFKAKSEEEQIAEAMAARKTMDKIRRGFGDFMVDAWNWGEAKPLSRAEEADAPEEVRRASTMLAARDSLPASRQRTGEEYAAASKTVGDWREMQYRRREIQYRREVRNRYEADLLAENAWAVLSSIMPRLSEDGQVCAQAIIDSKGDKLPPSLYATFENLPEHEAQMLIRIREIMKPNVEGGFWNTIGDMGVGAANVGVNIAMALPKFGNKLGMMAVMDPDEVNEIVRRRQYLYQVSGDFFAGGDLSSGILPQMQFENFCDEHGIIAEALIGAVSTLPYMAAAAVPYVGPALVATDAMNQMDDYVAMNGGDITDPGYLVRSAVFAAAYAYTERLQMEGLLGSVSDQKLREATLKGFFAGVKDLSVPRVVFAGTLAESAQEGIQNAIMGVNQALALDQDAARAFGEGFAEDFVGSLGTMFVVEAGGVVAGHVKRSGYHLPFTAEGRLAGRQARSLDFLTAYSDAKAPHDLVAFSDRSSQIRAGQFAAEQARYLGAWKQGGKQGLVSAGLDESRAEEWAQYFDYLHDIAAGATTAETSGLEEWADAVESDVIEYIMSQLQSESQSDENTLAAQHQFRRALKTLDHVRSVWASGAGVRQTGADGRVADPGAKALEQMGFTPDVAEELSRRFHYERAAAYSPAALAGIRQMYEAKMGSRVNAAQALASQFGGVIETIEGKEFIRFTDKSGASSLVQIAESKFDEADLFADRNAAGVGTDIERAGATDEQGAPISAARWQQATPAERAAWWKKNGPVYEGHFTPSKSTINIFSSTDPSIGINSNGAAVLLGKISLVANPEGGLAKAVDNGIADSSAGFHEVVHAFSFFAQASGIWTEADIEYLRKTFGEKRMADESFDEENMAEGFRGWLARRAAGELTAEDEKSPFAKLYRVAAGLDATATERSAKEQAASRAEEAFFAQAIADAQAAQAKPNETARAKPEAAPGEAAKPQEAKAAEQPKAPATAAEAKPARKTTEAPDNFWSAYTPTGNVKVGGHYEVLSLEEIIHSNRPEYKAHMRNQLRDRVDNMAEADKREEIVENLQPERLMESSDTANGAPIVFYDVDEQGVRRPYVLSGNGRVMVLETLAARHTFDKYRNPMKAWAEARGLQVPEGETPVLVRVIDNYGGATRELVADLSNTNSIQQYTEAEQAVADAEIVKSLNLAALYTANQDGTPNMTPGANDDFFREFFKAVGDTSLGNSDRSIPQSTRERALRALLAVAAGQGPRGRETVKKLVEQSDTLGLKRQKEAVQMMAAPVARLERNPAYAIGPDVSRALADYMDYAERKKAGKAGTFEEYVQQEHLFDGPSFIAQEILKLLGSGQSPAAMAEYVRTYAADAINTDPAGDLLGAARTREDIWRDAKRAVEERRAKEKAAAQARYSIIGRKGADNGGFGIEKLAFAEELEAKGESREQIWRATGWWRGADGKWRVEISNAANFNVDAVAKWVAEINSLGGMARKWYELPTLRLDEALKDKWLFAAYPQARGLTLVVRDDLGIGTVAALHSSLILISANELSRGPDHFLPLILHEVQHFIQSQEEFARGTSEALIQAARDANGRIMSRINSMMQETEFPSWLRTQAQNRQMAKIAEESRRKWPNTHFLLERAYAESVGDRKILEQLDAADESRTHNDHYAGYGHYVEDAYRQAGGEVEARNVERRLRMTSEERAATPPWETQDVADEDQIRFSIALAPQFREKLTFSATDESTAKATIKAWRTEHKQFVNSRTKRTAELKHDWGKIFSEPAKKKSASYDAHYSAANNLDKLFADAVKMWEEPPRNNSQDIKAYSKYGCPFALGDEIYLAKITVKEYANEDAVDGFYSIEAIAVEKISVGGINAGITSVEGHELDPDAIEALSEMLQSSSNSISNFAPKSQAENDTKSAPGDESHLLKWYDAISDTNWDRVIAQAEKEGLREKLKGAWWLRFNGDLEHFITDNGNSGDAIYERLSKLLGGPQSASEFLVRAGIDGVKYPVDSYGGKGVKDGDKVGWNYVSFRDDNIRVDHKWTDGQQRFSITITPEIRKDVTVNTDDMTREKADEILRTLAGQDLKNEETGIVAQINSVQRRKILSGVAVQKSIENGFTPNEHNAAASIIEKLWKHATLGRTDPDENGDKFVRSIKRFVAPVRFETKDAYAYLTVKESVSRGHRIYSIELEKLEALARKLGAQSPAVQSASDTDIVSYSGSGSQAEKAKIDPESMGRAAIVNYAKTGQSAAESALENYVAYFKLAHGSIPRKSTIAKLGLSLGMNTVAPGKILQNADRLAERVRGGVIEQAARNGDIGAAMAMLKQEKDIDATVEDLIAGAASAGGRLTHKGVGAINALLAKRIDQAMRGMDAATLADLEDDTGLDLAAEILANNPDAFDTVFRQAKAAAETPAGTETADEATANALAGGEADLSDYERHRRAQVAREANERVVKFIEAAKARAKENEARARQRREIAIQSGAGEEMGEHGGEGAQGYTSGEAGAEATTAGFKSPEEFAAFLRIWSLHRFKTVHGHGTLAKAEQDRLFAEFYRITARQHLQDLADKLLAPKDESGHPNAKLAKLGAGARVWVNRRLADLEKGARPDTIERASAEIYAFINKAAVRVSRVELIDDFKKELKQQFLKDPKFDEFKQDTERKVTGWLEEACRYILQVCDLSRKATSGNLSELEKEYERLHDAINKRAKVYDESGKAVSEAEKEDEQTIRARWKLSLLDTFGGMRQLMPGEILDLRNRAFQYLNEMAEKLEQDWAETRQRQEAMRQAFAAAIQGPNGQKYQPKGLFGGKLFDALNGMIRLRLEHLTRFATDEQRARAREAINDILVMLGDGETAFARALQRDRNAFFEMLAQIFRTPAGRADNAAIKRYLERLDRPIPKALAEQISFQGYADSMTYGQMLQLLVSLEQRSFKDAIKAQGRENHADLIRTFRYPDRNGNVIPVFTREDQAFIDALREFYARKRGELSEVTMRMVGMPVDSPDPRYMPVRRYMDDRARGLHSDPTPRWDPVSKIFSRRVENERDFDESRSITGLFFENSQESAKLVAWAERGSFIRNVVTSLQFQNAVKRAFGAGELSKILKQLEATFNGGESRSSTPGELAAVDKAINFTTYAYLGFNPLSAIKQTTSFTVWANALPGGFKDLWRHMTHFDRAALKHLTESEEFKVRYGSEVGGGMDYATKGLSRDPSRNPVARMLADSSMWMLKKGDFVPGGWIAQGVYKDLLDRNLKKGMEFADADKRAITETFNLLEETQQSGRTYNTNMLQIEHGRIGRLLVQFATSPLQQLQYETQAWREWRDLVRYKQDAKKIAAARQRFWRAAIINHILLPAALNLVVACYKMALGEEPPWEKDGWHWTLLIDLLLGQFARVFFLGAMSTATLNALFKREAPRMGTMLPVEGLVGTAASGAFLLRDLATMDFDHMQTDFERILKSAAPTRVPYNIYRRITGDSDQDRKRKKLQKSK